MGDDPWGASGIGRRWFGSSIRMTKATLYRTAVGKVFFVGRAWACPGQSTSSSSTC